MSEIEHCGIHRRAHAFRPITHYLRHQCPRCSYHQIYALCAECAGVFEEYVDAGGKYWPHWTFCPKCWYRCKARDHWIVYKPVA